MSCAQGRGSVGTGDSGLGTGGSRNGGAEGELVEAGKCVYGERGVLAWLGWRGRVGTKPEEVALFCSQGPVQQSLRMQLRGCARLTVLAGSRIELAVFWKVPPATSLVPLF